LLFAAGTLVRLLVESSYGQCQRAKLFAPDGGEDDRFGHSVAVEGGVVIVGAIRHDHFDAGYGWGAVYVHDRAAAWTDGIEITTANGGGFVGWSLAMDEGVAIVGAKGTRPFSLEKVEGVWTITGRLVADQPTGQTEYGRSVGISGRRAIVGAPRDGENGYTGAAYVFERDPNGVWAQAAKLLAGDAQEGDQLGYSVAIDGGVAVAGAWTDDDLGFASGSAYVFERDPNGAWRQTAKLLADNGRGLDSFGQTVAIQDHTILVGSPNAGGTTDHSGAVYVFEPDGAGGWTQTGRVAPAGAEDWDGVGRSLAIDGDLALFGANGDDDQGNRSGAVYVFQRTPDGWAELAKLRADDGQAERNFGRAAALHGHTAVVGVYDDTPYGYQSGSAYIFAVGPDADGDGVMDICQCAGDLDGDFMVGISDLATQLANFGAASGAAYEDGDLDLDGDVDLFDLSAMLGQYGQVCW
jgi:hypothetical protein